MFHVTCICTQRLQLFDERTYRVLVASVCGSWRDTAFALGQHISVLHYRSATRPQRVIVDDDGGLLVVSPARLVSGSTVASATYCTRRALLDNFVLAVPPPSSVRATDGTKKRRKEGLDHKSE